MDAGVFAQVGENGPVRIQGQEAEKPVALPGKIGQCPGGDDEQDVSRHMAQSFPVTGPGEPPEGLPVNGNPFPVDACFNCSVAHALLPVVIVYLWAPRHDCRKSAYWCRSCRTVAIHRCLAGRGELFPQYARPPYSRKSRAAGSGCFPLRQPI